MKKNIFLVLLLLFTIVCAYGQSASPIDVVLLLDTSSTMSSSYDNVNNYITGDFLNEFLRVGDTFHLIAFSANPRLDVARRISGVGDVETIIGRMLLQYPVENGSNISSALNYAEQYITSLPSRPKKIVLVSVGGSDTSNVVNTSKQRLNSRNATLDYIQVTPGKALTNTPKSGRPAASRATTATGTASSGGSQRSSGASGQTSTAATQGTTNSGTGTSTAGGASSGTNTNTGSSWEGSGSNYDSQGQSAASGSTVEQQSGGTSNNTDNYSSGGNDTKNTISAEERARNRNESYSTSLPFILLVIVLILLLLGIIIFLASRKLGSSPNRVMAEVASSGGRSSRDDTKFVDHSKELAKYASVPSRRTTPYDAHPLKPDHSKHPAINPTGPLLLNLFVAEQNTAIGKRNIHSIKSGYSLSVGGGRSDDYLIFLVPIPAHVGEIRRNGSSLTFIPKKPKYFPDIGSSEVPDCINKTIRIVSDKNYEMRFRFEMYEDPLVALNRVLMSFKVPG